MLGVTTMRLAFMSVRILQYIAPLPFVKVLPHSPVSYYALTVVFSIRMLIGPQDFATTVNHLLGLENFVKFEVQLQGHRRRRD